MTRLDENYSIIIDKSYSLRFEEQREKYDKKKECYVDYTHYESDYFPSLQMALERYVEYKQKQAKDLEELLEVSRHIQKSLEKFERIYFTNKSII